MRTRKLTFDRVLLYAIIMFALIVISLISCKPIQQVDTKFKAGELVYVKDMAFIVYETPDSGSILYTLKLIDCKTDYCRLYVAEREISKTPTK